MNYTNNQNCNSNNYCGCGQQYPVVPGSNPSLQTWNGQRFVVADGSFINPISLPYLQISASSQYILGVNSKQQLTLIPISLSAAGSIAPPSSPTDFSTLPGGIIPTGSQVYFANRDQNTLWTISASDSQWKIVDKYQLA